MDQENTFPANEKWFDIQKHLIEVSALNESAVRLVSIYQQLTDDPCNLHLKMIALEHELIFSRFLCHLFHVNIHSSSFDLKEHITKVAEIATDAFCSHLSLVQTTPVLGNIEA